MHFRICLAFELQFSQGSAGLVGCIDEHGQHFLHDEHHGTGPDRLGQFGDASLAQIAARETAVVEVDLRTEIARN